MDQSAGRLRPRTDDRIEQRIKHFLNSFRAMTENFITDLGNLLSETTLAFKDYFDNVDTTLTDGMEKIAVTLSQMHEQFKESTTNRNRTEAKERADAIKQKIIFSWNDHLSRRKDLFWKRLRWSETKN